MEDETDLSLVRLSIMVTMMSVRVWDGRKRWTSPSSDDSRQENEHEFGETRRENSKIHASEFGSSFMFSVSQQSSQFFFFQEESEETMMMALY